MLTVDPKKRLTVDQCLEHPWLKEAAAAVQTTMVEELKKSIALKKLKGVFTAVVAAERMSHMVGGMTLEDEK